MDITEKKEKGVELLHEFEHCAQASLCTYADEIGFPVETLKRFAAAFGGGMATEEGNCGALVGAGMVLGLKKYKGPRIHEETVLLYNTFVEKCGSAFCKELQAVQENGEPLCSCEDCVRNAIEALEKVLEVYSDEEACNEK